MYLQVGGVGIDSLPVTRVPFQVSSGLIENSRGSKWKSGPSLHEQIWKKILELVTVLGPFANQ